MKVSRTKKKSEKPSELPHVRALRWQYERETLGARIYRLRHEFPMTLRALATAAKISAPFLSDIEHDRRRPGDAVLRALAGALKVDERELFSRMLNRDTLRELNQDPALVMLIRKVMNEAKCRVLVLRAAGISRERAGS